MSLLALCVVIPLVAGLVCLFAWRAPRVQRLVGVLGALALSITGALLLRRVAADGVQVAAIGGWPAPLGITLVGDLFAAIMVLVAGVIALAVAVYALADVDRGRERFGYHPVVFFMLTGVCGAYLTGDLFNLFVWFEVMLTASFVLMTLGGERPQMEGAVKYVVLNLIASALFLSAVGVLYGKVGTLSLADLALRAQALIDPGLLSATAALLLVAFGLKAGVFPLFFWLPASYHTPPVAVSALFAGLLTKVGVYALIRVFTLVFTGDVERTHGLLLGIAALTMLTGVLGALAQREVRRLLSFHIISQIGYMILGLALFTPLGLAGAVYFIVHNILAKTNLFLVGGVAARICGTSALARMGGLYAAAPGLALLFFIPAMSLAGVPPLSGFAGKYALLKACLAGDAGLGVWSTVAAGVALAVGLLTLLSMTKIWAHVFWKEAPAGAPAGAPPTPRERLLLLGPAVGLALGTVALGVFVEPTFALARRAAEQLLQPSIYVEAVLGPAP